MKSYKYINELRKKIEDEEPNINKNRRRIRRLYWAINNNEELPNEEDVVYKSKKFLMKCSVENCRGYLSSQYKCNICENYTQMRDLFKKSKYDRFL